MVQGHTQVDLAHRNTSEAVRSQVACAWGGLAAVDGHARMQHRGNTAISLH